MAEEEINKILVFNKVNTVHKELNSKLVFKKVSTVHKGLKNGV